MLDASTQTLSGISKRAQKLQQQMLDVQQEYWDILGPQRIKTNGCRGEHFSRLMIWRALLEVLAMAIWGVLEDADNAEEFSAL